MTREEFIAALKTGQSARGGTRLLGQAGVWTVAGQLAIRGIIPAFPGVDMGVDILLESGVRIQVKTATLKVYGGDKRYLAYCFDCRAKKWDSTLKQYRPTGKRSYSAIADFFVLWGVDENRFWIIPTSEVKGNIWFPRRDALREATMPGRAWYKHQQALERLERTESRWDLLDVNETAETLVESAKETIDAPTT